MRTSNPNNLCIENLRLVKGGERLGVNTPLSSDLEHKTVGVTGYARYSAGVNELPEVHVARHE